MSETRQPHVFLNSCPKRDNHMFFSIRLFLLTATSTSMSTITIWFCRIFVWFSSTQWNALKMVCDGQMGSFASNNRYLGTYYTHITYYYTNVATKLLYTMLPLKEGNYTILLLTQALWFRGAVEDFRFSWVPGFHKSLQCFRQWGPTIDLKGMITFMVLYYTKLITTIILYLN